MTDSEALHLYAKAFKLACKDLYDANKVIHRVVDKGNPFLEPKEPMELMAQFLDEARKEVENEEKN